MGAQKQITNKMQSKKHSMLESITNVAVGFLVTLVFSPFIYTLCGMKYTWGQLGWVTLIFTALSIARSYVIRRFFNKKTDEPKSNLVLRKGIPCDLDHNGECLVCDCWLSDCGYQRYLNRDYKYESKEQLEHMFKDYVTKEDAYDNSKVTRFEVIDENGRVYTKHNSKIELSYQDDGRTLKVFVTPLNKQ